MIENYLMVAREIAEKVSARVDGLTFDHLRPIRDREQIAVVFSHHNVMQPLLFSDVYLVYCAASEDFKAGAIEFLADFVADGVTLPTWGAFEQRGNVISTGWYTETDNQ